MGGILIIFAVVLSTLAVGRYDQSAMCGWCVVATVGFGAVGFADDYLKFIKRQSKGLSATQKFAANSSSRWPSASSLYTLPGYTTKLSVPFFKFFTPDLGWFYIVFVILVIVGSSNAVNLTDGLDGLAIGPVMIASLAYTIVAYVTGNRCDGRIFAYSLHRRRGRNRHLHRSHLGIESGVSVVQHLSRLPSSWATWDRSRWGPRLERWPSSASMNCCCCWSAACSSSKRCRSSFKSDPQVARETDLHHGAHSSSL